MPSVLAGPVLQLVLAVISAQAPPNDAPPPVSTDSSPSPSTTAAKKPGEPDPGPLTPALKGSLSRREIDDTVRAELQRFRSCYERRLASRPELAGKLVLKWTIEGTGRVGGVALVDDTMEDGEVSSCVMDNVKSLQFPKPRGGGRVFVTYPFVFASEPRTPAPREDDGFRWFLPSTWCR